jgi:hypothetical protein
LNGGVIFLPTFHQQEHSMNTQRSEQDSRVSITTRIWAMATAMLAICIPFVGMNDDLVVLPVFVLLGTGLSTFMIWRSPRNRYDETMMLAQSIRELQQQLAHLQITSTDEDLKRKIEELRVR